MDDKWLAQDLRLGPYLGCIRVRDKVQPYYWMIVGHVLYAPAAHYLWYDGGVLMTPWVGLYDSSDSVIGG